MEWSEVEKKLKVITCKTIVKSYRCKENSERKIISVPNENDNNFKIKYGAKNSFKINLSELKQIFELIQKEQKYSKNTILSFSIKNKKLPDCSVQIIGKLFELSGLIEKKSKNSNVYITKNSQNELHQNH